MIKQHCKRSPILKSKIIDHMLAKLHYKHYRRQLWSYQELWWFSTFNTLTISLHISILSKQYLVNPKRRHLNLIKPAECLRVPLELKLNGLVLIKFLFIATEGAFYCTTQATSIHSQGILSEGPSPCSPYCMVQTAPVWMLEVLVDWLDHGG